MSTANKFGTKYNQHNTDCLRADIFSLNVMQGTLLKDPHPPPSVREVKDDPPQFQWSLRGTVPKPATAERCNQNGSKDQKRTSIQKVSNNHSESNREGADKISQPSHHLRSFADLLRKTVTAERCNQTESNNEKRSNSQTEPNNHSGSKREDEDDPTHFKWLPRDTVLNPATAERCSQNGSNNQKRSSIQKGFNNHSGSNREHADEISQPRRHQLSLVDFLPKTATAERCIQSGSNDEKSSDIQKEHNKQSGSKRDYKDGTQCQWSLEGYIPKTATAERNSQYGSQSPNWRNRQNVTVSGTGMEWRGVKQGPLDITKEQDKKETANATTRRFLALEEYQQKKSCLFNNSKQKPIDVNLLKSWAEMRDDCQLLLVMSSQTKQLEIFLNQQKLQDDCLVSLLQAVNNALNVRQRHEPIKQLLNSLCTTKFFEHLIMYTTEKQVSTSVWDEAEQFFNSCTKILEKILNTLPRFAKACMTATSTLLDTARYTESIQGSSSLLPGITSLYEKSKKVFLTQVQIEKKPRNGMWMSNNLEEPPDNFLDLSIIPTEIDLHADVTPFIRSVKTEGGYKDVHQYLDVQFRLMRQDFIIPLKEGITEFKKKHSKKGFKSQYLKFYYNVRIVGTLFHEGIDHVLHINDSKLQHLQQKSSKHLMFGSLVCLSKDNFETVIFATVVHDITKLDKGFIIVNFKTGLDDVFSSTSNDVYIMAETTAYFESYVHVLEGLQEMVTKLPLQDYIIHCKTDLHPPGYLLPSGGVCQLPVYDLSSLMAGKSVCKVPVLTTVKWPAADVMCLNESQRAAAQLALTKELAIIQGPPGTGKTYVGLKVMQVLLENKHVIGGSHKNSSDPILVVCYTNHALDQFLEGVLKFCPDGIVRVGGQSKSDDLNKFNLRNLKRLKGRKFSKNGAMEVISNKMGDLNQTMESLQTDLVNKYTLTMYMRPVHLKSLLYERARSKNDDIQIHTWLTISSYKTQSLLSEMIKQHLTMLILKGKHESHQRRFSPGINIIHRARFYCYCLKRYEHELIEELQWLSFQPVPQVNMHRMQEIQYWLKTAQTQILPDHQLWQFLLEGEFEAICKCLHLNSKHVGDNVIGNWLLRPGKSLHQQLDDVEILRNISKHKEDDHQTVAPDYTFIKEQNDRMVDVDWLYRDKIRDYVKMAVNSLASATKRAEALGIGDVVLMPDGVDNDEWEMVTKSRLNLRTIHRKLQCIKPMTDEEEMNVRCLWDLELDQRFALYNLWVQRYKLDLTEKMQEFIEEYKSEQEKQKYLENLETLLLLRKAKVIGMTTSGAAKHRSVLQTLGCRIIVVEEAAEVLESHIVTSLNKNCKHLILIGDHQQLRPNPTVYQLAKDFGLEMSLFERLVKNKVPHVMLKEQHRMRPEISKIMRHIYPDLQDHPSVSKYDKIRGVSKNIFFIQHENEETHLEDSMSKANTHEAKFLVSLYQYLLNQDYQPSQITILATYSGQVFEIGKTIRKQNLDPTVLVTAVDNYQGEENDIILLSLVRSNTEDKVGFLKVDNRVCVALSRARKGLYAIGNLELLASHSKLWKKIVTTATLEETIAGGLPVHCHNHPDFREFMVSEEDFQKCPEGGCGRPCQYRLTCGHVCDKLCHGYDLDHTVYKCRKPCTKTCDNGHACKQNCYEECVCTELVLKLIPVCGHKDQVPCYIPAEEAVCSLSCSNVLACRHQCSGICGECNKNRKHNECLVQVEHQWPCGHTEAIGCYKIKSLYACQDVCGADLECGHPCVGICGQCKINGEHTECKVSVQHERSCGHIERILCYKVKLLHTCQSVCEVDLECGHRCTGICGQCKLNGEHETCKEPVKYCKYCGHTDEAPCQAIPLQQLPCKNVCGAELKCGHICKAICSECLGGTVHVVCQEKCLLSLPCGHACGGYCSTPCLPCTQTCPNQCIHNSCILEKDQPLCGHMCTPCMVRCGSSCQHLKYSRLCSDNRDINPCAKYCKKYKLPCQHPCSGLCGELCVCKSCDKVSEIPQKSETTEDNCTAINTVSSERIKDVTNVTTEHATDKQKNEQHRSNNKQNQRLLKLPSCGHIFYVGDLDKYVSTFEPNGPSYIPCPVCQTPILTCIRYENINRGRSRKRTVQKEKLQREAGISEKQKADLQASQKALELSPLMADFRLIDVESVTNTTELHAVSFQLKCAFVLNTISSVMKNKEESTCRDLLCSRKLAVLRIKGRLTYQQREEFITELSRCFWLHYLSHLDSIDVPDDLKEHQDYETDAELRILIEALGESKVTNDILTRAELVSERKNKRIQKTPQVAEDTAKSLFLAQASSSILKTLASTDDDMLCHLIERNFQGDLPKPGILDHHSETTIPEKGDHVRQENKSSLLSRKEMLQAFRINTPSSSTAAAANKKKHKKKTRVMSGQWESKRKLN